MNRRIFSSNPNGSQHSQASAAVASIVAAHPGERSTDFVVSGPFAVDDDDEPKRQIFRGEGGDPPNRRAVPLTQGELTRYARALQRFQLGVECGTNW